MLRTMEADYRSDVRSCCKQMIMKWLKNDRNATWGKLFAVIESPAVSGGQAGSKGNYSLCVNLLGHEFLALKHSIPTM